MPKQTINSDTCWDDLIRAVDNLLREPGRTDAEREKLARLRAHLIIQQNQ